MKRISLMSFLLALLGCTYRGPHPVAVPVAPNLPANDNPGRGYADSLAVLSDAVVFFYRKDGSGKMMPDGTGFVIGIPSKTKPNINYTYLVTARHMVDGPWMGCPAFADDLLLRFNKAFKEQVVMLELGAQATVNYPLSGQVWKFPNDDMIDLAFTYLPDESLNSLDAVIRPLKLSNFATKEEAEGLRAGDAIVSAGLLGGASGEWRNYPILKWGFVSGVRGPAGEPLHIPSPCNGRPPKLMRETLLSASLVPGNSGSPIIFLPNELHSGRTFVAGVQSVGFIPYDVAGMAPIRSMLDKLRAMKDQGDLDLGPPDALAVVPQNR